MASGSQDQDLLAYFHICVEKEQAKVLKLAEKQQGKNTTVRKILKDGLGLKPDQISKCEASIYPKYQEKATKKMSDVNFVTKMLPDVAAMKAGVTSPTDPKAVAELEKMKTKLLQIYEKLKSEPANKASGSDVVNRLTDTTKYTGAHKERFGDDGKGKGLDGRENKVSNTGYVGAYKGEGTHGKK